MADWYDPSTHKSFPKVADYNDVDPTDVIGLLEAVEQRKRERQVKLAHFKFIEKKMQNCFKYHGAANYQHQCRPLIEEFKQTRDELLGWKADCKLQDNLSNSNKHYDPPRYLQKEKGGEEENV